MKKTLLLAGLLTLGAGTQPAQADGLSWAVGVFGGGLSVAVGAGSHGHVSGAIALGAPVYVNPQPVYVQPAPVWVAPAPVYLHPRPIYIHPAPVVVAPAPVYVAPQVVYRHPIHPGFGRVIGPGHLRHPGHHPRHHRVCR